MTAQKVQYANYVSEHGIKAATWMLDCKVLRATQVWHEAWLKNPKTMMTMINGMGSPLMIISEAYHILINRKAITPIKDLHPDNQKEIQELVIEYWGTGQPEKIFFNRCKMIYLFSQFPITIKIDLE
jgi:hypothetical protein